MDTFEVDYADMQDTATGFRDVATELRQAALVSVPVGQGVYAHARLASCVGEVVQALEDRRAALIASAEGLAENLDTCRTVYVTSDTVGEAVIGELTKIWDMVTGR